MGMWIFKVIASCMYPWFTSVRVTVVIVCVHVFTCVCMYVPACVCISNHTLFELCVVLMY